MTRCVVSFHFFLLLCFLVVVVFFHSISYLNRNISKKNFCFRDQQTPNKSFMKLFGYISGANEVTSKQSTHLSIKTWQIVLTKLTNTFFKGWCEDFHDSASVNQSYQCWGWRWLSAKVDLPGVCLIQNINFIPLIHVLHYKNRLSTINCNLCILSVKWQHTSEKRWVSMCQPLIRRRRQIPKERR